MSRIKSRWAMMTCSTTLPSGCHVWLVGGYFDECPSGYTRTEDNLMSLSIAFGFGTLPTILPCGKGNR